MEKDYFGGYVNIAYGVVFGGAKSGGVTAFAVSPNKQMVALALNNGQILVFNVPSGFQHCKKITTKGISVYTYIEFSKDNVSQMLAFSNEKAIVKTFIMKPR